MKRGIKNPGDGICHDYDNGRHGIHVVVPDCRVYKNTARTVLDKAYIQCSNKQSQRMNPHGLDKWRLLPISSGMYRADRSMEEIYEFTASSIVAALKAISSEDLYTLSN